MSEREKVQTASGRKRLGEPLIPNAEDGEMRVRKNKRGESAPTDGPKKVESTWAPAAAVPTPTPLATPAVPSTYDDPERLAAHVAELLVELGVDPGGDPLVTAQQLLDDPEMTPPEPPDARSDIRALPAPSDDATFEVPPPVDEAHVPMEPLPEREDAAPVERASSADTEKETDGHEPRLALVAVEKDEMEERFTFAVSRAETLEKTLAQRSDELAQLKEVASELAKSYENAHDRVAELEVALAERDAALAAATSRAEDMQTDLAERDEERRRADARVSALERTLAQRDAELAGATARGDDLERRLRDDAAKSDEGVVRISELEAALVQRADALRQSEETIEELRSAIRTQHDEIGTLADRANALEHAAVEDREVRARLEAAEQRLGELVAELTTHDADRASAVAKAAALQGAVDEASARLNEVTARLEEAESARETAVREAGARQERIAELEQTLAVRDAPDQRELAGVNLTDLDSLIALAAAATARAIEDANALRQSAMQEAEAIRREALDTADGIRQLSEDHARDLYERITETVSNSVAQGFRSKLVLEQLARVERKTVKQRRRKTSSEPFVHPQGPASPRWYSAQREPHAIGRGGDRPSDR